MIDYNQKNLQQICKNMVVIAKAAGDEILKFYNSLIVKDNIKLKTDRSPVTAADIAAHNIITKKLNNLIIDNTLFKLPILSEEDSSIHDSMRRQWIDYWLIDPLDGTKEYIDRSGEFCVNIALISNKRPIVGVICAPYFNTVYYAIHGQGAYKIEANKPAKKIFVNKLSKNNPTINIVTSKRHYKLSKHNDFLDSLEKKL